MTTAAERPQSLGEEIANSISHGIGLLLALIGTPVLIYVAAERGTLRNVVGAAVFGASMVLLYLSSTLYHAIPQPRAKSLLRLLDHGAIYLLIAGTYTPFTLGVLRGPWGWTLFGLVWTMAILGIAFKSLGALDKPVLSTILYLAMGWMAVIAVRPFWLRVPAVGLLLIAAGGLAYTAGVAFFQARRLRYAHFIWHLWVMAGTICHFFAVLWYAA
jgi:hemolysin III